MPGFVVPQFIDLPPLLNLQKEDQENPQQMRPIQSHSLPLVNDIGNAGDDLCYAKTQQD